MSHEPAGGRTAGCALVTGGSGGIGAAISQSLAERGWPVVINYESQQDRAQSVAEMIIAAGGSATLTQGDVSDPTRVEEIFTSAEAEFGPVLVLVNNAGWLTGGVAARTDPEVWNRSLAINLTGAFLTARRAIPKMVAAGFGRIVNVSSITGIRAWPAVSAYSAAKAGLIGMTRSIGAEVGRLGITVNAVAPGPIDEGFTKHPPELLKQVPLRRAGRPDEVAACVSFLASSEASYVNGSTLVVDGGLG